MLIQIFLGILDAGVRQFKGLFRAEQILRLAPIHPKGREAGEPHTSQEDQEQERRDQDDSGLRFEWLTRRAHARFNSSSWPTGSVSKTRSDEFEGRDRWCEPSR